MEDFEREQALNEVPEEIPEEAVPEEDVPEDEAPGEEEAAEEAAEEASEEDDEDGDDDSEPKSDKPIKGPRFFPWLAALLTMLFGLAMLLPAIVSLELTVPAVRELLAESAGDYDTAQEALQELNEINMTAQSMLPALSSGNFAMERQYVVLGKLLGPLYLVSSSGLPPISETFTRVPRNLRALSAQCDALLTIINALQALPGPAEGQDQSEFILEALESLRAADKQAKANKNYYDTLALHYTVNDSKQNDANRARVTALRKDPTAEFWMYEEYALYFAGLDGDFDDLVALCETRLNRNPLDYPLMPHKVKALFLAGREEEAFAAADNYAKHDTIKDTLQLTRVELHYRKGEYKQALALCDEMIVRRDLTEPLMSQEDADVATVVVEAIAAKGAVLLLQGKTQDALDLMSDSFKNMKSSGMGMTANFAYTMLTAHIAAKDEAGAKALIDTLKTDYGVAELPKAITALQAGDKTVKAIYTEGLGGFDA